MNHCIKSEISAVDTLLVKDTRPPMRLTRLPGSAQLPVIRQLIIETSRPGPGTKHTRFLVAALQVDCSLGCFLAPDLQHIDIGIDHRLLDLRRKERIIPEHGAVPAAGEIDATHIRDGA